MSTPRDPQPPFWRRPAQRVQGRLEVMAAEKPVLLAFYVFLVALIVVVGLSFPLYLSNPWGFLFNIMGEAHGMVFDLLVIGWFMFWLNRMAERRIRNNRYREEIEDFLGWRSPEATHRIAGNIRRLNRSGIRDRLRLTEAFLQEANLAGVSLEAADLWGANLDAALLDDALLDGANLAGASLQGANLERASLVGTDLRGANLTEADLERALLTEADLRGANLSSSDLQFAVLDEAHLDRANLYGANLRNARLQNADLRRAILENTNLRGADLHTANLQGAALDEADLSHANLEGAQLSEGDALLNQFRGVRALQGAQLDPEVASVLQDAYPYLFEQPGAS